MKNKKSIGVNFLYNAFYNTMKLLFPLITIPYLSRVLLSDGLGKVNYAVNIVTWFLLFASLGIPRYGVREIAKNRKTKKDLNTTFSELFEINFISTVICVLAYLILIFTIPFFRNKLLLYAVTGIQLVLNVFNVDWFYQGIEEYGYITKRSLFIKVISLISMFLFVKTHDDYIIYAFIQSMAVVGNYFFNFYHLRKNISFVFTGLQLKKHIIPVFILFSTQLSVNIYALLDTTMLGMMCSDSVVGYYSNVHKVISTICVLTASLGGVMLPRLVQDISENNYSALEELVQKAKSVIIAMCLPISVGLFLVSGDLVKVLFGFDFMPAIMTMRIFAPFVLISTIGNLYGTQLLMAFDKEKKLLATVVIGAVINLCMNFFLIQKYQHNGAAIASVITEFIVMVAQIVVVKRIIKIAVNYAFIVKTIVSVTAMTIVVLLIQILVSNIYIRLILSVGFGALVYMFIGYILKSDGIRIVADFAFSKLNKQM